jgi:hypothetical protein
MDAAMGLLNPVLVDLVRSSVTNDTASIDVDAVVVKFAVPNRVAIQPTPIHFQYKCYQSVVQYHESFVPY